MLYLIEALAAWLKIIYVTNSDSKLQLRCPLPCFIHERLNAYRIASFRVLGI